MKNKIKIFGLIALTAVIGFAVLSCDDGDPFTSSDNPLTIAGTFASQNAGGLARFSATVSGARSFARSVNADVAIEGLLEDGDIIFRLKGSYNNQTKTYVLSAAGSWIRYSITGDFEGDKATSGMVILQVNNNPSNPSAGEWTTSTLNVTTTGNAPSINGSGKIEDELAKGIPQVMWGNWWGTQILDMTPPIQANEYFYAVDAFTVILYVKRYNDWNIEGYVCFFDGVTPTMPNQTNEVSGIVSYHYNDHEGIERDHPNWHVESLIAYAETIGVHFYMIPDLDLFFSLKNEFSITDTLCDLLVNSGLDIWTAFFPSEWNDANAAKAEQFEAAYKIWLNGDGDTITKKYEYINGHGKTTATADGIVIGYGFFGENNGKANEDALEASIQTALKAFVESKEPGIDFDFMENFDVDAYFTLYDQLGAGAQSSGFALEYWMERFADYFFIMYQRQRLRLVNGKLEMGIYHKPGNENDHSVKDLAELNGSIYSVLKWGQQLSR